MKDREDYQQFRRPKEFVLRKVEKEREQITYDLERLWRKYIKLLSINTEGTVDYLREKDLIHYRRMLKMRKSKKTHDTLTRKLTIKDLEKHSKYSEILRKGFKKYLSRENSRGLCFPPGFYKESLEAVYLQDIYEPDISQKRLFSVPVIEEEKSFGSSILEVTIREEKRHLVFLCHGFNGHHDDLKYLRAAIMESDPSAKVYSCLKNK